MYYIKRTCSKILPNSSKRMADKQEDLDRVKTYGQRWKNPSSQISFSKTSLRIKDVLSRFQDLNKRSKDTVNSMKGGSIGSPLGPLSIPDMFSQRNNYFEDAAKLVTSSEDQMRPDSIHIHMSGAPGELEGCLLSNKDKQLIHKLVIQALYRSSYKRANGKYAATGFSNSVSYYVQISI